MSHNFLDLLFLRYFYGKFRAKHLAETAVHTIFGLCRLGGVISFGVKSLGFLQDVFGTELNAKPASLAPVFHNFNLTSAGLYLIQVQRFSPYLHNSYCIAFSVIWCGEEPTK